MDALQYKIPGVTPRQQEKLIENLNKCGLSFSEREIYVLIELIKLHKKYKKEIKDLFYYPRHPIDEALSHAEDIRDICQGNDIIFQFSKIDRADHMAMEPGGKAYKVNSDIIKYENYCKFFYKNVDITNLIKL